MADKVKLPTQAIEFSSERKQYTILELYHKHKKRARLPLVLKVKQGYYGGLLDRPLAKDEILVLAVASTQYRVMARQDGFFKKRILSIPSSFTETVCVVDKLTNTYDRECYMYSILQENKLPVLVRLPQNRVITVDRRHYDAKDIPGFYLEKRFDEITLQGNMILEGKVEENEILAVPIFLTELKVSIVNGIKGRPKKEWLSYQEKLRDICENVPYDFVYGSPKIAEYSHNRIEFDKDYAIVEPKCYVSIQDLVEIIPQEMMQQYLEEQELNRKAAEEAIRKQLEYATFKEREQAVTIQEPPVVDNDDDRESNYETIELPPEIKPKPFIHSRAPMPTPVPEPVSIGKPPAPEPDSESPDEYKTHQHPMNQYETDGELDLNTDKFPPPMPNKPNISISEPLRSSPKKTKLPLSSELISLDKDLTEHPLPIPGKPNISETTSLSTKRPKLPLTSEALAVDIEETKYQRPSNKFLTDNTKEHSDASKAEQIALKIEKNTKSLTKPKPQLYAKPKIRSSSQSEEASTSYSANLQMTETNKVTDAEEAIGLERIATPTKRETRAVPPLFKISSEEKDLSPITIQEPPVVDNDDDCDSNYETIELPTGIKPKPFIHSRAPMLTSVPKPVSLGKPPAPEPDSESPDEYETPQHPMNQYETDGELDLNKDKLSISEPLRSSPKKTKLPLSSEVVSLDKDLTEHPLPIPGKPNISFSETTSQSTKRPNLLLLSGAVAVDIKETNYPRPSNKSFTDNTIEQSDASKAKQIAREIEKNTKPLTKPKLQLYAKPKIRSSSQSDEASTSYSANLQMTETNKVTDAEEAIGLERIATPTKRETRAVPPLLKISSEEKDLPPITIQEPPVVDNDDDRDNNYETIELPPGIKPKPFIHSRAPMLTPVPKPVSIGKPPAPEPDSESPDEYETPQHPMNQYETDRELDLNKDKLSISEPLRSSPKKTKLPLSSEVVSLDKDLTEHPLPIPGKPNISFSETTSQSTKRPNLPLLSGAVAVDIKETNYPRPSNKSFTDNTIEQSDASKAKQIAREIETKTKPLTKPKLQLYAKPKIRSSSQSDEASTSYSANLQMTETNKVTDAEEEICLERIATPTKREPRAVLSLLKISSEEKTLPPITIQEPPVVDNDDDLDSDYETIELPPEIKPKPFIHRRAPVPTPVPETKIRSSSQSEEPSASYSANLQMTETNKVTESDAEEAIGLERIATPTKREPKAVPPLLMVPSEEKDLPPIPAKSKPPMLPAPAVKSDITCFPTSVNVPMISKRLSLDENDKTEEYDDTYEYVSLSLSVRDKLVTRNKQDREKKKDSGNELYKNILPALVVNPVKSLPKQNTERDAFANNTFTPEDTRKPEHQHNDAKIMVASLTIEDVCDYLEKLHLEKYSDKFIVNMVDGELLLSLDEDVLTNDFEIKKIEAKRLLRFAKEGTLPKLRQK